MTSVNAQPPQQQAPPPQLPEPEQASPSQLDADPNVQSAMCFLQDPRVRNSPIEAQIRFLKGKSMSDAQIQHAFTKVGRSVTAEKIASVRAPTPTSVSTANNTTVTLQGREGSVNISSSPPKSWPLSSTPQPPYSQTLFPRAPPPLPEEPQGKSVDWRDVVIGAGAAVLAGVAGYKLFNRYSPYEIRRKSEKKTPRSLRSGGGYGRPRVPLNASSESETDVSSMPPLHLRAPPLPPPPPQSAAAESATAAAPAADAEELKKVQQQLDETKEALTNERKKCADLAVSSAKIRAEKQQLSRANDRLTQQVDALKKDVEKLEEKAAAASGEAKLTATEEEPPKAYYPSLTAEAEQARDSLGGSPASAAPLTAAMVAQTPPVLASAAVAELAAAVAPPAVAGQPIVETFPVPQAAPLAAPEVTPAPAPPAGAPTPAAAAPVVEAVEPISVATAVPPAFLTPDPLKPEEAATAPATN